MKKTSRQSSVAGLLSSVSSGGVLMFFPTAAIRRVLPVILCLLSCLFCLYLQSCNPEPAQNTRELAQEMSDRKIKRVTSAQVASIVDEWGNVLVASSQKALMAELAKNPDAALCEPDRLAEVRKLEQLYSAQIQLVRASDVKNPALPAKEREVLDAYLYNAEQKLPQSTNVQKIADTLFVYNAAVPADNPICKVCTDNAAVPFVVWRVVFNKREVIRRINTKALSKKK